MRASQELALVAIIVVAALCGCAAMNVGRSDTVLDEQNLGPTPLVTVDADQTGEPISK